MKKITDRLHRLQGQIAGVEKAIESETTCNDVIPQLLAIKGAVNSVVQVYLEESLDNCVQANDAEKMRQVIKTLVKQS